MTKIWKKNFGKKILGRKNLAKQIWQKKPGQKNMDKKNWAKFLEKKIWQQKYFIAPLIGLKKFRGPLGDLNGPVLWTLIVDP